MSTYWRQVTTTLSLERFRDQFEAHHVILPHVQNPDELMPATDALLATTTLQDVWLEWLLSQLDLPAPYERFVRLRWRARPVALMRDFAPYAGFVLRVTLAVVLATRYQLIRWRATNVLDLQYLYYMPFCMVFASSDYLHRFIAPLLVRDDQTFAAGTDLKTDLQRAVAEWDGLTDQQRSMLAFALGSHPMPKKGSVVYALWKKHMRPWGPGSGNRVTSLSEPDQEKAVHWVEEMVREADAPLEERSAEDGFSP